MPIAQALFRSGKTEWETPPALFGLLQREFSFTLDVCATPANRKCTTYFSPVQNGLRRRWFGTCWMNPPYGREIGLWVRKAQEESSKGVTIVCLLPVRTDTVWWQDTVLLAQEIRLLRGRLRFVGAQNPAPFPSAVVVLQKRRNATAAPLVTGWDWRSALRASETVVAA